MTAISPFARAFELVVGHEGGFVDHPSDPGGATRYGVTERVARKHGYDGDMRQLPLAFARQVHFSDYWYPIRGDDLPEAIGFEAFDAAVNHGVRQAALFVQRALGVADDGIIGPVTIAAARKADPARFIARFNGHRLQFYTDLKTWPDFGKGWSRRVAANLRRA